MDFLSAHLPEDVRTEEGMGNFSKALKNIEKHLEKKIPSLLRERLKFEKERIDRYIKEYPFSYKDATSMLAKKIKDFKAEELKEWKDEGYIDYAVINGEERYQKRFAETILKTFPGIEKRDIEEDTNGKKYRELLNKEIDSLIDCGRKSYSLHLKAGIKLKQDAIPVGEKVRAWIPIPRKGDQIEKVEIVSTSPTSSYVSDEQYPQRTIFFEQNVKGEDEFIVEYTYQVHLKYTKPDPSLVRKSSSVSLDTPENSSPQFYLREEIPHILFSPYLRSISKEVVGDETNPLLKARKIYDFITTEVRYSYVPEYSTYENITEFAASNLKGDCGVQALLFITLCRIAGVPAKWQSGLVASPYFVSPHDWAQFYVEPFGWLFVDVSFGGSRKRKGALKHWDFYFGNIDPFRMVANSEFQYPLEPEKLFYRSDPYDNQRGEVEWDGGNVYYDRFETIMKLLHITGLHS